MSLEPWCSWGDWGFPGRGGSERREGAGTEGGRRGGAWGPEEGWVLVWVCVGGVLHPSNKGEDESPRVKEGGERRVRRVK